MHIRWISDGAAHEDEAEEAEIASLAGEVFPALSNSANEEVLSAEEADFLARYRSLDNIPQLAIRCYLNTGDDRLLTILYHRICLGLPGR